MCVGSPTSSAPLEVAFANLYVVKKYQSAPESHSTTEKARMQEVFQTFSQPFVSNGLLNYAQKNLEESLHKKEGSVLVLLSSYLSCLTGDIEAVAREIDKGHLLIHISTIQEEAHQLTTIFHLDNLAWLVKDQIITLEICLDALIAPQGSHLRMFLEEISPKVRSLKLLQGKVEPSVKPPVEFPNLLSCNFSEISYLTQKPVSETQKLVHIVHKQALGRELFRRNLGELEESLEITLDNVASTYRLSVQLHLKLLRERSAHFLFNLLQLKLSFQTHLVVEVAYPPIDWQMGPMEQFFQSLAREGPFEVRLKLGSSVDLMLKFLSSLSCHASSIKWLALEATDVRRLNAKELMPLVGKFQLFSLELYRFVVTKDEIACLKEIQGLALTDCTGFKGSDLGSLCTLQCLQLSKLSFLANKDVEAVVESLPQLKVLDLSYCPKLSGANLALLSKKAKELCRLCLAGTNVGDADLLTLDLAKLETLDLTETFITEKGIENLQRLPSLRTLICKQAKGLSDTSCTSFSSLATLQELDLSYCPRLTLVGIELLVASCPQIQRVHAHAINGMNTKVIQCLSNYNPDSYLLHIDFRDVLSKETISILTQRLKLIKTVKLSHLDQIEKLAKFCEYLSQVLANGRMDQIDSFIVDDFSIKDAALSEVIALYFPKLKRLSYRGPISFQGILKICSEVNLRAIKDLRLKHRGTLSSFQTAMTDDGLFFLSDNCKQLERLSLCNMAGITTAGMQRVIERCTKLLRVRVKQCPQLPDNNIFNLMKKP